MQTASKDRTLFSGDPKPITAETGKPLLANSGEPLRPEPPKEESDPGKITPTAGAMDRVAPDRVDMITQYVDRLKDACAREDGIAAAELTARSLTQTKRLPSGSILNRRSAVSSGRLLPMLAHRANRQRRRA